MPAPNIARLIAAGFVYTSYDQDTITHGYSKRVPMTTLMQKLAFRPDLVQYCTDAYPEDQQAVVEYLPEVGDVQWSLDPIAGLYKTYSAESDQGEALIELFINDQ